MKRFNFIVGLIGLCLGCFPETKGISPPDNILFFPTGMDVTPSGEYLLVCNSNYDLKYNAGTVVAIDLERLWQEIKSRPCERGVFRCKGIKEEKSFILRHHTIRIPSYGMELIVDKRGKRAFVSVRSEKSITVIDIRPNEKRLLRCFLNEPKESFPACDSYHRIGRFPNREGLVLPEEPFGIGLDERDDDEGYLIATHLLTGKISVFSHIYGEVVKSQKDTIPYLSDVQEILEGVSALGVNVSSGKIYVTSRSKPLIPTLFIVNGRLVFSKSIPIMVTDPGTDSRGVAFAPDGSRVYVAHRAPSSVLFIDPAYEIYGRRQDYIYNIVEVGRGPSVLRVHSFEDGTYLVYVVCFEANQIFVLDPDLETVIDVIQTGKGPHSLVFDPIRKLAYIAHFTESTIGVINMDPKSPSFHRLIFTLGIPKEPKMHD